MRLWPRAMQTTKASSHSLVFFEGCHVGVSTWFVYSGKALEIINCGVN